MRPIVESILVVAFLASAAVAGPVSIFTKPATLVAAPGSTVSFLVLIHETDPLPIFGYSLDVEITPGAGAPGTIAANIAMTNFFDTRNLITAAGALRDPTFSQIFDSGDGGVFITTNTSDDSTVIAVDHINDVLAQVFFDVSGDASGDFTIDLGPASAIGGAEFIFEPATISVVPEPGTIVFVLFGAGAFLRRRQR